MALWVCRSKLRTYIIDVSTWVSLGTAAYECTPEKKGLIARPSSWAQCTEAGLSSCLFHEAFTSNWKAGSCVRVGEAVWSGAQPVIREGIPASGPRWGNAVSVRSLASIAAPSWVQRIFIGYSTLLLQVSYNWICRCCLEKASHDLPDSSIHSRLRQYARFDVRLSYLRCSIIGQQEI